MSVRCMLVVTHLMLIVVEMFVFTISPDFANLIVWAQFISYDIDWELLGRAIDNYMIVWCCWLVVDGWLEAIVVGFWPFGQGYNYVCDTVKSYWGLLRQAKVTWKMLIPTTSTLFLQWVIIFYSQGTTESHYHYGGTKNHCNTDNPSIKKKCHQCSWSL
jgi:hypothetical protein